MLTKLRRGGKAGEHTAVGALDGAARPISPRRRLMHMALLWGLTLYAGVYFCQGRHLFDFAEDRVYTFLMAMYADRNGDLAATAHSKIVLVTISDDTYDAPEFTKFHDLALPRSAQAKVIDELRRAGARVIGYDILFDAVKPGDDALAAAARRFGRVVWGCEWSADPPGFKLPEPRLLAASPYTGHARFPQTDQEPWILRCEPLLSAGGLSEPAWSLVVAGLYRRAGHQMSPASPPLDDSGAFRINYFGSMHGSFHTYPFLDIFRGVADDAFYRDNHIFAGKIVLIGDASLNHDAHPSPMGVLPGVVIQANAIATLLLGAYIRVAPPWVVLACAALLCALCGGLAAALAPRLAASCVAATLCLFVLGAMALYVLCGISLPLAQPTLCAICFVLLVVLDRSVTDHYDKRRMRGVLGQYVSPQIMQQGAPTGDVTLVFTDLEGSSELSERLGAAFERARNTHFELLRQAALKWNGFEVETAGDSFFGVFQNPADAVRFGVDAQKAIEAHQWPAEVGSIRVRIGMHTGTPFIDKDRARFTYRGPATNRAARVMGVGNGGDILLSGATLEALQPHEGAGLRIAEKGVFKLKGIGEQMLYEVRYRGDEANLAAAPARELSVELTHFLDETPGE